MSKFTEAWFVGQICGSLTSSRTTRITNTGQSALRYEGARSHKTPALMKPILGVVFVKLHQLLSTTIPLVYQPVAML
jgi:hypothetical protein